MNMWFQKIQAGCDVKRFHTLRLLQDETVGEHSFRCALFADYIYTQITGKKSENVLRYMLLHDIPECDMGDVPFNTKDRDDDLSDALYQYEEEWIVNNVPFTSYIKLMNESGMSSLESTVCHYVDRYDAVLKLIEEYKLGNSKVVPLIEKGFFQLDKLENDTLDLGILTSDLRDHYKDTSSRYVDKGYFLTQMFNSEG